MTKRGTTNVAIWIELPTLMEMASIILFFMAIQTLVTCSAAFAWMKEGVLSRR